MKIAKFARSVLTTSLVCASILASSTASASIIVASGDSNLNWANNQLSQFYANMFHGQSVFATPGWSVSNTSTYMNNAAGSFTEGTLTATSLTGKQWFVASTNSAYSAEQLGYISRFVTAGGNLFVIGEGPGLYAQMNVVANQVLAAAGSAMRIGNSFAQEGPWTATGADIGVDALTSGITSFGGNYAATVTGGKALFISDFSGYTTVAVEHGDNPVPEPTSLALFGLGLAGLSVMRRRKTR